MKGMEVSTCSTTEEDFRPQKANTKKGSTKGQTWEVDNGKEWLSTQYQATGKQVARDPLERNTTRNTARHSWVVLETMKELEDCLKKLDRGVSRKRRHCITQQKAEMLEASRERNLRSINLTHGECPCDSLAQTVWYPEHSNLCLKWDV